MKKLLYLLIPIWTFFVQTSNAQTRLGLHVTQEELTIWRTRANSGPYKTAGDVSANSPGDWARILDNANKFKGSSSTDSTWLKADRWLPWPGTGCYPKDPIAPNNAGIQAGLLKDAAFVAMVKSDGTYLPRVKSEILKYVRSPLLNFADSTRFCYVGDQRAGFMTSEVLTRLVFAFDYVRISGGWTSGEQTEFQTWIYKAAKWLSKGVDQYFAPRFVNRVGGNYTLTSYATGADASSSNPKHPLYYGGPLAGFGTDGFNNRILTCSRFAAMVGILNNASDLQAFAKRVYQDYLKYSVFPGGDMADMTRWTAASSFEGPETGLDYSLGMAQGLSDMADVFARKGDVSLYTYSTEAGAFGTASPGQPKTLLQVIQNLQKYMNGTHVRYGFGTATTDVAYLINGIEPHLTKGKITFDVWFAMANLYFQNAIIKSNYLRQASGTVPYPTPATLRDHGPNHPWGGQAAVYPGILFMFGKNEGLVSPYPGTDTRANQTISFAAIPAKVYGQPGFEITASASSGLPVVVTSSNPAVISISAASTGNNFSFTLPASARTSAGVYNSAGSLVRTLWSGVSYNAGTYSQSWDGKDDAGTTAPTGTTYSVKLLSNNVSYTWEGVIGNTSTIQTGPTKLKAYEFYCGMVAVGSNAYFAADYGEGISPLFKSSLSNVQIRNEVLTSTYPGPQSAHYVCSDGVTVFWAGRDPYAITNTFVIGTQVSNDAQKAFSAGTSITPVNGFNYPKAIAQKVGSNQTITGMAVQSVGDYLFVARGANDSLYVYNRNTGAFVRKIYSDNVHGISVTADDSSIWLLTSTTTATKHTINSDGTLSAATLTLSGLVSPIASAVSPDNSTVIISDGSTSQQVKAYSNSTGAASWTLGQSGGYASTPTVANDRFMFNGLGERRESGFLAFQSDGSFWVGDGGNQRMLHFSSARAYIDQIAFQRRLYNVAVDLNNPTRVFANYLEYQVDYTKPLLPNNGSWTLVKNWGYGITSDDQYFKLRTVATLSNSRTYSFMPSGSDIECIELTSTGIRHTGVLAGVSSDLNADGSLNRINGLPSNVEQFTQRLLTGFNGSGNPVWGTETILYTTAARSGSDPYHTAYGMASKAVQKTSGNFLIQWQTGLGNSYHLGGMKTDVGLNNALVYNWKTANSVNSSNGSSYPVDGRYEIGNRVQGSGGNRAHVFGRNILWGYNGEFWNGGQTNKFTHYYDNGLMVATFGQVRDYNQKAVSGMAGNSFSNQVVQSPIDTAIYYLYHNDESDHGGVHRWKISNRSSISEQTISLGSSSVNATILSAGSTTITVSQAGNSAYYPAPNAPQTIAVAKASQVINFPVLPDIESTAFNFTVSPSSSTGLPVTTTSENSVVISTGSPNQYAVNSLGEASIKAYQPGDDNYLPATLIRKFNVRAAIPTGTINVLATAVKSDTVFAVGALPTNQVFRFRRLYYLSSAKDISRVIFTTKLLNPWTNLQIRAWNGTSWIVIRPMSAMSTNEIDMITSVPGASILEFAGDGKAFSKIEEGGVLAEGN